MTPKDNAMRINIVNIVATARLGQRVSLENLAHVNGFLYDARIYRCAYLKDGKTRGKVSIFSTGRMISTGTKRFRDSEHDLEHATRRLVDLGLITPTEIEEIEAAKRVLAKISNLV